jgi:hypothetical protein
VHCLARNRICSSRHVQTQDVQHVCLSLLVGWQWVSPRGDCCISELTAVNC